MVCDQITLLEFSIGGTLSSGCISQITRSTYKSVNVKITGGVGPFTYQLLVDGSIVHMSEISEISGISMVSMAKGIETLVSVTAKSWTRKFDESIGSHLYEIIVTDSCPGSAQTARKGCTIEIISGTTQICRDPVVSLVVT